MSVAVLPRSHWATTSSGPRTDPSFPPGGAAIGDIRGSPVCLPGSLPHPALQRAATGPSYARPVDGLWFSLAHGHPCEASCCGHCGSCTLGPGPPLATGVPIAFRGPPDVAGHLCVWLPLCKRLGARWGVFSVTKHGPAVPKGLCDCPPLPAVDTRSTTFDAVRFLRGGLSCGVGDLGPGLSLRPWSHTRVTCLSARWLLEFSLFFVKCRFPP